MSFMINYVSEAVTSHCSPASSVATVKLLKVILFRGETNFGHPCLVACMIAIKPLSSQPTLTSLILVLSLRASTTQAQSVFSIESIKPFRDDSLHLFLHSRCFWLARSSPQSVISLKQRFLTTTKLNLHSLILSNASTSGPSLQHELFLLLYHLLGIFYDYRLQCQ